MDADSQKPSEWLGNSREQSRRPDFLGKKHDDKEAKVEAAKTEAADELKSAETNASGVGVGAKKAENGLTEARQNEESAEGFYTGGGRGGKRGQSKKGSGKKSFRSKLKRKGPIGLIIGMIFGFGGLMSGAQLMQPFSLAEQLREAFNSMQVSTNRRSNVLIRYQLDRRLVKDPLRSKIFSSEDGRYKFSISKKQANRLSAQGIEYDDNFENQGIQVLKYKDDATGEIKLVAANENDAKALTQLDLKKFDVESDGIRYNATADSFKNVYGTDSDFFAKYNSGSLTWRGAIANWFGSLTDGFLANNKVTRNVFRNYRQEVESSGESPRTVAIDMMSKGTEEVKDGGVRVASAEEETETVEGQERVKVGEDGYTVYKSDGEGKLHTTTTSQGGGTVSRVDVTEAKVKDDLNRIADNYSGGSLLGSAQKVANYGCLALNFFGGVTLLVTASQAVQILSLISGFLESVDKVKAGYGNDSPMNEMANSLNERANSEYETITKSGVAVSSNQESNVNDSGIKTLTTEETKVEGKSAMESSGIISLYGGGKVNPNDPSVKSFNLSSNIKRVLGGIGTSMAAFETCAFAKLVTNAAGATQAVVEVIGCLASLAGAFFTLGASAVVGCGGMVSDLIVGAAISVAAATLIKGMISLLTPVVFNMLKRDIIATVGEPLGNALTSGGSMYMGMTHRTNGGSLASREEYEAYELTHQEVIAENARYERMTKDPFDATSKYTFMGSLLTQMMSLINTSSIMSTVTSASSVVSSSIIALTPAASAYEVDRKLIDNYEDTCPYLASIGAVGDAFCNPYIITDVSTINQDPSELTNKLDNNFIDETTEDGNVIINKTSDLAKYILYCDNRTSMFGIADQNFIQQLSNWGNVDTGNDAFDNTFNAAVGSIPVVGDVIDVIDNKDALKNAGYISGESCVAGNTFESKLGESGAAPNWEKAKDYQRFIEDQSLMESMGIVKESAVTAFLNDYYEENPLDNSYEGILARYSGMTKEDVIALLDIIDYYEYIANYDASERYAFGAPVVEEEPKALKFSDETAADNVYVILSNDIVFADVRNRSFVV